MINLLHIASVPILAFNLGFVNPQIDLNHNIREKYKTQVIQQRHGTDNKADRLESFRTRRSPRNKEFVKKLRERFNERYGDQRRVAQFYVNSWFVASFSLDLNDNTLLRIKDIYAKAISEVGLVTKGNNHRGREWREKAGSLKKIYSTFDHELRGTLDSKQYKKLIEMSGRKKRSKNVDKGET